MKCLEVEKPKDWGVTSRECRLENIVNSLKKFKNSPTIENREILISLVSIYDLNEMTSLGVLRITDYEIAKINYLYLEAKMMNFPSLISYLYYHIADIVLSYRMAVDVMNVGMGVEKTFDVMCGLHSPLQMFFKIYRCFRAEKNRTLAETIVKFFSAYNSLEESYSDENIEYNPCLLMMEELSHSPSSNVLQVLLFNRTELYKIFECLFTFFNKAKLSINERPFRGILAITISNWILKSRYNYNTENIHKYVNDNNANKMLSNGEIWIQKTEFLNDKREGNLIREILKNKKWIEREWAKKMDLNLNLTRYVTSFSKSSPTKELIKEYGKNVFSYKTDRIASNIAPLQIYNEKSKSFSTVKYFDIIYGLEDTKLELNYLFSIIDLFKTPDNEKTEFLNHIIMYWDLSFKDKKWNGEKERRYLIFIFDDTYDYRDIEIDSRFLKIKTTLFLYPDFISKENVIRNSLELNRFEKVNAIKHHETLFCKDCLNDDIIVWRNEGEICSVCKSENIIILNEKEK